MKGHSGETSCGNRPPPVSFLGRDLTGVDAWAHVFSMAWEDLETDKEDLDLGGLDAFARAVAAKHGDEDAAVVARRLFPEAGPYFGALYPGYIRSEPTAYITPDDVPF